MTNKITKYKVRIKNIELTYNKLLIESDEGVIFMSPIKKGSVECRIFNESRCEVNLSNLEENILVTIHGCYEKESVLTDNQKLYNFLINEDENNQKNIIVIKNIVVKNNYMFTSDTSDDLSEIV